VSTACPDWQDGVVAATGHDNGDVLLWSIEWDSGGGGGGGDRGHPLSQQRAGEQQPIRRVGSTVSHRDTRAAGGDGGGLNVVRPLKLERVLSGAHQKRITFVRVCEGGREMLVGDASGAISRWQCIRLDQLSSDELNGLV
ncbi:unnamed protein product, partial [Hapterophycus canaliculatus]